MSQKTNQSAPGEITSQLKNLKKYGPRINKQEYFAVSAPFKQSLQKPTKKMRKRAMKKVSGK